MKSNRLTVAAGRASNFLHHTLCLHVHVHSRIYVFHSSHASYVVQMPIYMYTCVRACIHLLLDLFID
jgi:hypothetical protein